MKISRSLRRLGLFASLAVVALAVSSPPAKAVGIGDCVPRAMTCLDRAAQLDNFYHRSLAGLQCATDFVWCIRNSTWF